MASIMFACDLSWNSVRRILELLVRQGYAVEIQGDQYWKRYYVSERGMGIVNYYAGRKGLEETLRKKEAASIIVP